MRPWTAMKHITCKSVVKLRRSGLRPKSALWQSRINLPHCLGMYLSVNKKGEGKCDSDLHLLEYGRVQNILYKNSHLDEGRMPRSQQFYHNKQKHIVVCIRLLLKSFKLELCLSLGMEEFITETTFAFLNSKLCQPHNILSEIKIHGQNGWNQMGLTVKQRTWGPRGRRHSPGSLKLQFEYTYRP